MINITDNEKPQFDKIEQPQYLINAEQEDQVTQTKIDRTYFQENIQSLESSPICKIDLNDPEQFNQDSKIKRIETNLNNNDSDIIDLDDQSSPNNLIRQKSPIKVYQRLQQPIINEASSFESLVKAIEDDKTIIHSNKSKPTPNLPMHEKILSKIKKNECEERMSQVHEIHLNIEAPEQQQHFFQINIKGGLRKVNVNEIGEKQIKIEQCSNIQQKYKLLSRKSILSTINLSRNIINNDQSKIQEMNYTKYHQKRKKSDILCKFKNNADQYKEEQSLEYNNKSQTKINHQLYCLQELNKEQNSQPYQWKALRYNKLNYNQKDNSNKKISVIKGSLVPISQKKIPLQTLKNTDSIYKSHLLGISLQDFYDRNNVNIKNLREVKSQQIKYRKNYIQSNSNEKLQSFKQIQNMQTEIKNDVFFTNIFKRALLVKSSVQKQNYSLFD